MRSQTKNLMYENPLYSFHCRSRQFTHTHTHTHTHNVHLPYLLRAHAWLLLVYVLSAVNIIGMDPYGLVILLVD